MQDITGKTSHSSVPHVPTARQGQCLANIHHYGLVNGCSPAEADMQRFFQITAPSVHSMVLTLERRGFIRRVPGQPRSITLLMSPESLPPLKRTHQDSSTS
jgi:DNA-binding MarR family transcriptional regulator